MARKIALADAPANSPANGPEWQVTPGLTPYDEAITAMERRVDGIEREREAELLWLLQHPPLYTKGTSADDAELVDARFPVFETGRGGRFTYHGPGQRVVYALMDLRKRERDVRAHVWRLEEWMIRTLSDFGITGERRQGRIGIWVATGGTEKKIGAIGVRVRKWIAYHGLALNVAPELSHFNGIVPCGISDFGVTSLRALAVTASMDDVDVAFKKRASEIF